MTEHGTPVSLYEQLMAAGGPADAADEQCLRHNYGHEFVASLFRLTLYIAGLLTVRFKVSGM